MENSGTIFNLIDGNLVEMNAGSYVSEDDLQRYLEKHVGY